MLNAGGLELLNIGKLDPAAEADGEANMLGRGEALERAGTFPTIDDNANNGLGVLAAPPATVSSAGISGVPGGVMSSYLLAPVDSPIGELTFSCLIATGVS